MPFQAVVTASHMVLVELLDEYWQLISHGEDAFPHHQVISQSTRP